MLREHYLQAIGVDRYRLRGDAARSAIDARMPEDAAGMPENTAGMPEAAPGQVSDLDWSQLQRSVAACTLCELHASRTQTVFGVGNQQAELLVIGEAPGADEDRQGEPFVGRAGKLLDAMLAAIGLDRKTVYIANILKCRPPGNRDPRPEESVSCRPYLERQIALIRPQAVLAVGRIAAQQLLGSDQPVGKLRGRVQKSGEAAVPVVVTYHPAYLLRSPQAKGKAWQDLCLVRGLLRPGE